MEDCLFCKIAAGEIPSTKVYEDDHWFAFRDINPSAPVHVLLIPRQHVKNILALTDETNKNFSDFFLVVKKIAEQEGLGDNGFRLVINTGAEAGQTVFHFHIHLIPRYENDNAGILWEPGETTPEDMAEVKRLVDGE